MTGAAPKVDRATYARMRSFTRTKAICSGYARYEVEKSAWSRAHPSATPAAYEAAMQAIAKACGV